jgi:glycosyltransferase involved in cell wall biosynthesis
MEEYMISVITPSFNQAAYLNKSIQSVLAQKYPNFEHIVIDGGSTDASLDVLNAFPHLIWISETDNGQAHAVNKGFRMAGGDIIGWLNSDDTYTEGTFHKVNNIFRRDTQIDFIFSNCFIVNGDGHVVGFLQGKNPENYNVLDHTNFIPQPTVFFRKHILQKTGFLHEAYHLSMDFDYWRRVSRNHKMKYVDDEVFACFRLHNHSKTHHNRKKFKHESKLSFFQQGGSIFSPYYFETFIKPFLLAFFVYNPLTRRLFFRRR